MFFKTRNVLMMLFVLLFTVAVGCSDDEETNNNSNNDKTDVRGDQDSGNGDNDANGGADVEEDTTPDPPTCSPLSPAIGTCDALCNTGCVAGESCVTAPVQGGGMQSQCMPTGTGTQGSVCNESSMCAEGHACLSVDGGAVSNCYEYCRPNVNDPSQCGAGLACMQLVENVTGLGICATAPDHGCTIYPNAGCGEGEQCYNAQGGGKVCAPFNADAVAGNECGPTEQCNENQVCAAFAQGVPFTCFDACPTPGDNSDCAEGFACQGLQGETYGVCTQS